MKKYVFLMPAAAAALLLFTQTACFSSGNGIVAKHTAAKPAMNGVLDDPVWYKTPAYTLVHGENQFRNKPSEVRKFFRRGVVEPGKVKVLWDEQYLYFGFEFTDRDLVSESEKDQDRQDRKGDAVSVFLKPLNHSWYWEFQVSPKGNQSVFFYPGRGLCKLPSCRPAKPAFTGIKTAAACKGTLNNFWDKDKKWTAEIAIPRSELERAGEPLDPGIPWLVFIKRVNFGRELPVKEYSVFPSAPVTDFHAYENFGRLILEPGQKR